MSSSYYPTDTCTTCAPYYAPTYLPFSPYSPSPDTPCYTSDTYYTSDTSYSMAMVYYPTTTSCDGISSCTSYYYPQTSTSSYYYPDTESTTSYNYPPDIGSSSYYPEMSCSNITSSYYYPPYTSSSCYPDTSCTSSYYYAGDTSAYYPDMSYSTSSSYYYPPCTASSSSSYYRETSSSYSPPTHTSPSHYGCLSKLNSYLIKAESSSLSGYTEEYSYLIWTPADSDTGFTSYSFCSVGYSIFASDSHAALLYSDSGCLGQGTASLAEYWKAYPHHLPPTIEAERLFVLSDTSYPYPVGLDSNVPSGAGYSAFGVDSNGYLTYGGQQSWALCTPSSGSYTTDTLYLYWLGGNACPDYCYPATLKLVPYGFPYPVDHYYKNHGGNCGAPSYPMAPYTTEEHGYTTSTYTSPHYPVYITSYGGDSYSTITYDTLTYTSSTPYGGDMYTYSAPYGGDTYSYCTSCSYSASHGRDYGYPSTPTYPIYTPPYGGYQMGSSCGDESYSQATPTYPTYPTYSPPYGGYTDSYTDSYTLSSHYSPPMQYDTDLYETSDSYYTASYFSTTPIYTSITERMTTSSTYTVMAGGQVATAYTTTPSYDE